MTPDQAKASHRRFLTDRVDVFRMVQGSETIKYQALAVRARVIGYKPEQMSNDVTQGDQLGILYFDDLVETIGNGNFPGVLQKGDVVKIQGRTTKVMAVDQNTRKVGQTIIALECQLRGS